MDAIVVGCGLSGAVVARFLAERNKKVLIIERRNHIGGNMYDYIDEHGILVQKYGPHTFHTTKKSLYEYICKFSEWKNYKLTCGAVINNRFTPTPFNFQTIDDYFNVNDAKELKDRIRKEFINRDTATVLEVLNCNDEKIRAYGKWLFENDYSLYTAKQWGCSPKDIDKSVLERVPLRFNYEVGYFSEQEIQVMPKISFTKFFEKLLEHPNIEIKLNTDAIGMLKIVDAKIIFANKPIDIPVIYTGEIDALFGFVEGKLPYRSLKFKWVYEENDSKLDAPVVAYPQVKDYTRIVEYKKLPIQYVKGTSYAIEYPISYVDGVDMEPYYPVLTKDSQELYVKYLSKASKINNLYLTGRLADFKYYNMDQALEKALDLCEKILI